MRAMRRIAATAVLTLVGACAGVAFAARVPLVASPGTVSPGGVVIVSARFTACHVGSVVTLLSAAFPGHAFGIGTVDGRVGSHGAFSVRVRVRKGLKPGRYHVGARCGGGNLGVSAYFRVR